MTDSRFCFDRGGDGSGSMDADVDGVGTLEGGGLRIEGDDWERRGFSVRNDLDNECSVLTL
jgi:hypothetical protein